MSVRNLAVPLFTITASGVGVLFSAGGATAGGPPQAVLDKKELGLEIKGNQDGSHKRQDHDDGRVTIEERASVSIEGKGARVLKGVIDDQPIAKGGQQKATITDNEAGQTVAYTYDPGTNSITIDDGTNSVNIVQNPDHSYQVDGTAAATGKAAVDLLADKPAYSSASAHGLMLAYSYALRPNAAAKGANEDCALGCATPPAVCVVFEDFCECAVCDKAGKGRSCAKCK